MTKHLFHHIASQNKKEGRVSKILVLPVG